MARTHGSIGLTRVEFESDFYRYCEENGFKPGLACAKLMHKAAQSGNVRDFVSLGVLADRTIAQPEDDADQGALTLVVDRTAEALEHSA